MIYLDHAATTPIRPEALAAMQAVLEEGWGNSSGIHSVARRAKNLLEDARDRAASLLGCRPAEVVFTGGGTESDNLAVLGRALVSEGAVVVSAIEHEAVLGPARLCERFGREVRSVGVNRSGIVDPEQVAALSKDAGLVSVMTANNETGAIQPIAEISRMLPAETVLHTDAVQAFGSIEFDLSEVGLFSLSGHKFGGPKGVGLLYISDSVRIEPLIRGGGHEMGRRPGTVNVAGAAAMVAAMESAAADRARFVSDVSEARRHFEAVVGDRVVRTIPEAESLPQHLHVSIPGVSNETVLVRLDQAGVAASPASSCHSGAPDVSHVLNAMGMEEVEARSCVRFSFGWNTTRDEAGRAARILHETIEDLS